MFRNIFVGVILWAAGTLNAQVISGVVNAASLDGRLSPGALAIITGTSLGAATATPVTVGGKAAAVVTASSSQITIQIPVDAPLGATTVQVAGSAPVPIQLTQYAPALFTSEGKGYGNLSGSHADGSPIDGDNPAITGETVVLYATGLGPTVPPLATGAAGPSTPPAATAAQPTVLYASQTAAVVSSVMAPGLIGVYQVTVRLTTEPVTGTRAVGISIGGASSGFGVSIPIAAPPEKMPLITSVLSATGTVDSIQNAIQAGSWVSIYGTDLTYFFQDWTHAISGDRLPTALAGVKVTIDGKPAAISYISPTQINVQAPSTAAGAVPVVVTFNGTASAPFTVQARTHAPAFFQWGATKYAVATRHPDGAYIGSPSLGTPWVPASLGDTLILWGTGFGPTNPPVTPGIKVPAVAFTADEVTVTIGGASVPVLAAALSPGLAGVYEIAILLPSNVPLGDGQVRASIAGYSTPENVFLNVVAN